LPINAETYRTKIQRDDDPRYENNAKISTVSSFIIVDISDGSLSRRIKINEKKRETRPLICGPTYWFNGHGVKNVRA